MFTLMNMLIGVLCEVVTAVSEQSQEETKIDFVRLAADVQMKILEYLYFHFDIPEGQRIKI